MSLTIKKVSFGNNGQSIIQRNFSLPALNAKGFSLPTVDQSQNNNVQSQNGVAPMAEPVQSQPVAQAPIPQVMPQPVQAQTPQQVVPTVVAPMNNGMQQPMPAPVYQTYPVAAMNNKPSKAETVGYVAAGLALISLGVNAVSGLKNHKAKNMSQALDKLEQQIASKVEEKLNIYGQKVETSINGLSNRIDTEVADRKGLGKYFDGIIDDIHKSIKDVEGKVSEKSTPVILAKGANFLSKEVTINGNKMRLANTLNGYGRYTGELEHALRTESSRRMLGLIDRSNMLPSDNITIRVPTAEFNGFAKTGGMADVPREVIANLGAFINNKQNVRLVLDMPMYLGEILYKSDKNGVSTTNYALNALGNGKYNWVSKFAGPNGSDKVIVGNLEKIASAKIPVYDDMMRTVQDVDVYMAKGIKQDVDYNLLRSYLDADTLAAYNKSIQNYEEAYRKFYADTAPLRDKINADIAPLEAQITEKEKRLTENISAEERTNIASEINSIKEQVKSIRKPLEDKKAEFKTQNGNLWKQGLIDLVGDGDGHIKARVSFDGIFYKNEKFEMQGPRFDGEAKTIYDNKTINSGESERFAYFDKFFYEFLSKSHEYTNERLGADLIIGNDWHTGGISAMMRLLTKAKDVTGELSKKEADKLYNTPVVTILHNARLSGQTAHSNSKLLNILFGEHAAEIVENAYMPDVYKCALESYVSKNVKENPDVFCKLLMEKKNANKPLTEAEKAADEFAMKAANEAGLPAKCWNGLMHGECVNPQTMATAYSDTIIPVSDKYMEEIATQGVYGRENFELFRLRKWASDHSEMLNGQKTIVGITNGCDRVNNELTAEVARTLEKQLALPDNSLRVYKEGDDVLEWHNHNKKVILDRVIADVKDPKNPMKLSMQEMTDLTGVNENTMIVSTAGRIVDQKGLDIFAESIEEMLRSRKFPDGNYPVFYAQGDGVKAYIDKLLEIKRKVASSPELGGEAAAKRIVFANLFSEPGRYDACKLMSDYSIMSSWFEPCGLVHKQFVVRSGAIPIVNMTGGLTSGLTDGVDAIFSKFKPDTPSKEAVIGENKKYFAEAMGRALDVFNNKEQFRQMMTKSFKNDFSWLVQDGPMAQYAKVFADLKVLKPQVLQSQAA